MSQAYANTDPPREEIEALPGAVLLEFGSNSCGICSATQPRVTSAMAGHPKVQHVKIEDGRGRRLGRSFGVKLWPTLVFMQGGKEVARLVRPHESGTIQEALDRIDPAA